MSACVAASRSEEPDESIFHVSLLFLFCVCFFLNWASNKHVNFPIHYKQLHLSAAHKDIFTTFESSLTKL